MKLEDVKEAGALVALVDLLEKARVGSQHNPIRINFRDMEVILPEGFEFLAIHALTKEAHARLDALGVVRPTPNTPSKSRVSP